jgi:hypothetical protein
MTSKITKSLLETGVSLVLTVFIVLIVLIVLAIIAGVGYMFPFISNNLLTLPEMSLLELVAVIYILSIAPLAEGAMILIRLTNVILHFYNLSLPDRLMNTNSISQILITSVYMICAAIIIPYSDILQLANALVDYITMFITTSIIAAAIELMCICFIAITALAILAITDKLSTVSMILKEKLVGKI